MKNKFRTTTWSKYSDRKELEKAKEEIKESLQNITFMYYYYKRHMKECKDAYNKYDMLLKDVNKWLKKHEKKSK